MRKLLICVFILPLMILSHQQDEDLFSTKKVEPGVLILLDRSLSMDDPAYEYDTTEVISRVDVVLSAYSSYDHSTDLEGWYDSEIFPDGPGEMNYFDDSPADDDWILTVSGQGGNDSIVVNDWTLRFYTGGSYTDFSGGSFALEVTDNEVIDTIAVTGMGTVDSVECYLSITAGAFMDSVWTGWWWWGHWEEELHQTEIGDVSVILDGPCTDIDITPTYLGTRMQSALLVIHSLLDANGDGFVTEEDEEELPIKIGQGCHASFFTGSVFVPEDAYTYYGEGGSVGFMLSYPASQEYNESTQEWDDLPNTWLTMETDTLGSRFDSIWSHVNSTSTGGYTPNGMLIGHAVEYINEYRDDHPGLWCMQQNLVLITDGLTNGPRETCSPNASGDFNYEAGGKDLVRESYLAWHDDSIRVFAVGFGTSIDEDGRRQLNWAARWGGTCANPSGVSGNPDTVDPSGGCPAVDPQDAPLSGYAYIADDANALAGALQEIFEQIAGQEERAFSSAEVTSIEEDYTTTEYEARMYLASFYPEESSYWEGHLRSVRLVPGGLSFENIPDSLLIWDAGDLLRDRDPSTRNIYGISPAGNLLYFTSGNFSPADLGVVTDAARDSVINLVRSGNPNSDTVSYLGDIFHSSPLRVGSPNYWYQDDGFAQYRESMLSRPNIIYAGSNTGMIHAFYDSTGEELFGIVPQNFVNEVKALRDSHRFYVDADPMAAEIWFPTSEDDDYKNANEWKTVLAAAQGEGGRAITFLDVTDPKNPSHLFSFEEDTIALTTSTPVMFKVGKESGSDTVERFFAFFGGGEWPDTSYDIYSPLDSTSLKGNVIVALDIHGVCNDGAPIQDDNFWYIEPESGDEDKMAYPFASAASVVNLNPRWDTRYDLLYIPDLAGQLWKVDLTNPDVDEWRAKCIFQPPIPSDSTEDSLWQPAFYAPLVEREPATGCLWLFYGTGDRSSVFKENTCNRFYAILDTLTDSTDSYPLTEGDLKQVWTEGPFDFPTEFPDYKGWYILYSDSSTHVNEKTVSQASLFLDTLAFVTFEPTEFSGDCNIGIGGAREYSYHFRTGSGRFKNMGTGIPQAPRYSFDKSGGGFEIHQTSDSLWVELRTGLGTLKRILKWKER